MFSSLGFVSYRSGSNYPRKKANVEHPRERKSVRCGCDAKLYLTKEISDGVSHWYVSQFSNVHNHELLEDDQVRLLPAYRKIHELYQERILFLSKAGFPVNRIVKVLESEKGFKPGNLPFIEKDVRNFISSSKRSDQENNAILNEKRETEMLELIEALKAMAEREPDFFYDFTTDENKKPENVSWTFGNSVRAFTMFGDVVTFVTSYHSINYGLLLGVWFGIDNHGKPILLGCVLLREESTHSVSWALQSFIRSMRGACPQTILTDMDSGLKESISRELPNTKHVIGLWHVLSKISSWFSFPLGSRFSDFKADFDMVCRLENVEEFEHHWNLLAPRYGLASDRHIELLHLNRAYWPFCSSRSCFLACMMTPGFSHSLESFLKRILSGQTCLQGFFEQVNIEANSTILIRERTQYLHINTCMPMEEHARTTLTPYAFRLLQDEITISMQYGTTEMANGSYLVRHYKEIEGDYLVLWVPDGEQIHCSCKGFEHSGILCRHCVRVLVSKNYFQIPEKYFLLRWRAESSLTPLDDHDVQAFHSLAASLLTESSVAKERYSYVRRELSELLERVRSFPVEDEHAPNDNNVDEP